MKPLLITSIEQLNDYQATLPKDSSIGLVPTMGALHKGHLSLMEASKKRDSHTIVSIFVNPTQFGENEDFNAYPRDLQKDLALCETIGVNAIFAPEINTMYPTKDPITLAPPKTMGYLYEGFLREGHFNGVLSIVLKLLMITKAKNAYFGQKDAQQLLLIQALIKEFFLPVEIIPCPIQRDIDGLALSSRNVYLTPEEREIAQIIPRTLNQISQAIHSGQTDSASLIDLGRQALQGLNLEYLDICDYNLLPLEKIQQNATIILLALKIGKTRLLDNLWV